MPESIPFAAREHPLVAAPGGRVLIRRMAEALAHLALADPTVAADPTLDTPEGRRLVRRLAVALVTNALGLPPTAAPAAPAAPATPPLDEYDPCA